MTVLGRTIAFIPARGGSKRLPRKNILEFRRRPMIAWTIDAALEAGLFDTVVVSTEDAEIAEVAVSAGAVVAERSSLLAGDDVSVAEVLCSFLDEMPHPVDRLAVLLPNCPFRTGADIRGAYDLHRARGGESTMSVVGYGWRPPQWAMHEVDGWLVKALSDRVPRPTERVEPWVCPSGAIRWIEPDALLRNRTFYGACVSGYELPWYRAIDIDTAEDLEMARCVGHALDHGFRFGTP